MFALCVHWDRRPIDPTVEQRIARSLEVGLHPVVTQHQISPGLFAATRDPAACTHMPDGRWLLFHGFLQNRAELRTALGVAPSIDAGLYAAARQRWGDAADARVIGEYAAIVIDPARPAIQLARAAVQGPPIHWHRGTNLLAVGSVARAVFATGALRPEVDEQKIADSLYLNYTDAGRGWFRGISRLLIGSHSRHDRDGCRTSLYYDLADAPSVRLKCDEDYVEAASTLLRAATRSTLEGRTRPAIALSGGLDSQTVAAHALPFVAPDTTLLALTGVPEPTWDRTDGTGKFGDERSHVAAFAALHPALATETVDAAGKSFDYRLDEMLALAGGPPRNAMNLHWLHDLHARAKARGCDVLLTGSMGNATISYDGGGALPGMLARGRWAGLVCEVRAAQKGQPFARTLYRHAVRPYLPSGLAARLTRTGDILPAWCPLDPAYAREMHVAERADPGRTATSTRGLRRWMLRGASGEAGDLDQAMDVLHGIPLRDPTAYRPLVAFCLGIPDDQFLRSGIGRQLARRMLRGKSPDPIVDERRIGVQCADWHLRLTRSLPDLKAEVELIADDPTMARRFDVTALRAALAAWPERTPTDARQKILQLALPRALVTARFLRLVETSHAA